MAKQLNIWLSETGDYEDFEASVNAADSFSLTVPTTNEIRWLKAVESLLIGTSGDEWRIGNNELDTPLTPTNFSVRQQTDYGSTNVQPAKVNELILFVDFVGRKVRELTLSGTGDKYVAPDLTSLAEHITLGGITGVAHQKNPDSILWCTVKDANYVLSMTYEREQNVVAWAIHPIGGTVYSISVIPSADEDEIWITVGRTINDEEVTYIERMKPRVFGNLEDAFFVDSGKTSTVYDFVCYEGAIICYENEAVSLPSTVVTKLGHLEGEEVAVLGDGVVLTSQTVRNAQITLPTAVRKAQVGIAYAYKLKPMRLDITGRGGTTKGSIKKIPELVVSFLNSLGVQYSSEGGTVYDIDFDDERWVNTSDIDGLFTGDVVVTFDGGFNVEDPILISGSSPTPCTVRAIIVRIDVTGR